MCLFKLVQNWHFICCNFILSSFNILFSIFFLVGFCLHVLVFLLQLIHLNYTFFKSLPNKQILVNYVCCCSVFVLINFISFRSYGICWLYFETMHMFTSNLIEFVSIRWFICVSVRNELFSYFVFILYLIMCHFRLQFK